MATTTSKLFSPILPLPPLTRPFSYPRRPVTLVVRATSDPNPISTATNTDTTTNNNSNNENKENASTTPRPQPLNIRYRSRRAKQRQLEAERSKAAFDSSSSTSRREERKTWEEMSPGEKALELYMGEKGLLFWLNKFAYASIFIVIGGWILFRFAGPALNLYQLEAPPLSPDAMLKSSAPN